MKTSAIKRTDWMRLFCAITIGLLIAVFGPSLTLFSAQAGSQTEVLLAQNNKNLTAAEKAERRAKRKAREERSKKRKERAERRKKRTDKAERRKKRQEKTQREQRREKAKQERRNKRQIKAKQERRTERKKASVKEIRAERKRRARLARKRKGHNVWYSERRAVRYRGREHHVRSRHVVVVRDRYRNRYRRGLSIYYLPPEGAVIAAAAYVISASLARPEVVYDTLYAPPVMPVNQSYAIDEIVEDPEIRHLVRSVDMDINFATGSAEIPEQEYAAIDTVAGAMARVLKQDPDAIFLIEGHTDATGDPQDNIFLSEDRAATVVAILENEHGIPSKNLEAVGYGAQYLKEETFGPSQANRRVVVRNISGVMARN